MYKHLYRRFLEAHPGEIHFTAHSHHFWPDVTREAQLRYWDDSARHLDGKWDFLFEQVVPETQRLVADAIGSNTPEQIVFGTSTHEFVCRLLSCFEGGKSLAVLTTDGEFHSFRRQIDRLAEYPWVTVERVPVEPLASFGERFLDCLVRGDYQMVFLSQVFFNSGYVIPGGVGFMEAVAQRAPGDAMIVWDGYHGFCALPTAIRPIASRVFYLAGGYKYAQAGEGACFLHVPVHCALRPADTGWFAEFSALAAAQTDRVAYPDDGRRFAGATFDPSGIYRLRAVLDLFRSLGIGVEDIHRHVTGLQALFLNRLDRLAHGALSRERLLLAEPHGHFFVFRLASPDQAARLAGALKSRGVYVDVRGDRIRFGFGLYHDVDDIEALYDRLDRL